MESSSFSDRQVIAYTNQHFVPLMVNLTTTPFPDEIAALKAWKRAYQLNWRFKYAFATSVVTDSTGTVAVGTSGSGYTDQWKTAINYHPDLYLQFLQSSADRDRRLEQARQSGDKAATWKVTMECLKQMQTANSGPMH